MTADLSFYAKAWSIWSYSSLLAWMPLSSSYTSDRYSYSSIINWVSSWAS